MTGTGVSPWRPNSAMFRSDCSVLVGSPVEGPPRWVSMTISGNSVEIASDMPSDFRAMPGPALEVTPSEPAKDAPMAVHTAAISSSAWKVLTRKSLRAVNSCNRFEAGVIG